MQVHETNLLFLHKGYQFSSKSPVPELACDTKAKLVVKEVVSKVVLLHLPVPEREVLVVEEVVRQVVTDVSKDASAIDSRGHIPIPPEESVGQLPERGCQDHKQSRWHHKPVPVHG